MDLRTKLVFALVGVSLGSMLILGVFGYQQGRDMLEGASLLKLDAVAESRKQDLENVMLGWGDRVRLIGSRTQLRLSLAAYNRTGDARERERMNRILDDARGAVASVDYLAVFDLNGLLVASSWTDPSEATESALEIPVTDQADAIGSATFLGYTSAEDGRRQVRYVAPLRGDDATPIGWLTARLSAAELLSISQDYTGLGETGETMIVAREPEGVRVLHPVRHPGLVGGSWIPERGSAVDPAAVAADGRTARLLTNVTDYRGEAVWAATRFLPDTRWGVVVKVDAAEEQIPIDELRDRVVRLALALSAFAILGGILLGLQLTRPIQELVRAANLILAGETDARAQVRTHDEVGLLARVFNRMADALTARDVSIGDDDLAIEVEAARERLAQETAEAAMMSEDRSSSTGF
jgi:HAMP domain-containing protein